MVIGFAIYFASPIKYEYKIDDFVMYKDIPYKITEQTSRFHRPTYTLSWSGSKKNVRNISEKKITQPDYSIFPSDGEIVSFNKELFLYSIYKRTLNRLLIFLSIGIVICTGMVLYFTGKYREIISYIKGLNKR